MRTMIAVPCMDMVHADFFRSCVGMEPVEGEIQWTTCQSSLIYDSRNKLADIAIRDGFDRILWLDSDMSFDRFLLRRLSEHLDQGREMVTGLYFTRKDPIRPVIYSNMITELRPEGQVPVISPYVSYARDSLFPVAGCGFGAVMMTVDLLREVREQYPLPFFPDRGFGEDLIFCLRARAIGKTIWCDSSIKLGHVGSKVYDETLYRQTNGIFDD